MSQLAWSRWRIRIDSSNVPADFDPSDSRADPSVVDEAKRLDAELANGPAPIAGSPYLHLESGYVKGLQCIAQPQKELDEIKVELTSR
jgi:hypothetical protein